MRVLAIFAFFLSLSAASYSAPSALDLYKSGDYQQAIPALASAVASAPADDTLYAALLSSLVYQGQVDAAASAALDGGQKFPDSPAVIAARGEFAYYMGDTAEAETLFRAALKRKETNPRAYFGLYRLYEAAAMHHTARLLLLRAHAIDPDDALITRSWLFLLPPSQLQVQLVPFIQNHPWLFKHFDQNRSTAADISGELKGRKAFQPVGDLKEITIPLIPIRNARLDTVAVGLPFQLNGGRPLTLLLDTGASGILINQRAVERAKLNHLGSFDLYGIGDNGAKNGFAAVSENCSIGALQYNACLLRVGAGNLRLAESEDGLIGTDFFARYIVQIDFQKMRLHLTPQPPREPNPQGVDAKPPSGGWTRVFRYGHQLCVPTNLNGETSGLFVIDTGSAMSVVDATFARLSTKLANNSSLRVHGLSGDVKNVFQTEKAVITFAGYRQENVGLTSFNLNNSQEHQDVRMDGLLGFPLLRLFRLSIDYRNSLVKFEYKRK